MDQHHLPHAKVQEGLSFSKGHHLIPPNVDKNIIDSPKDSKRLRICVLGLPNVGKSSMVNALMGVKVSITSPKVQTTVDNILGVATIDNVQLEFIDAPGVVGDTYGDRLKLSRGIMTAPWHALQENVDLVMTVFDACADRMYSDAHKILNQDIYKCPAICVFNKMDKLAKKPIKTARNSAPVPKSEENIDEKPLAGLAVHLNRTGRVLAGVDHILSRSEYKKFDEFFFTSAKTGRGIDMLKEFLISQARPGKWRYPPNLNSYQSFQRRLEDLVREKLLFVLQKELPYSLTQQTLECTMTSANDLYIHHLVLFNKDSQVRIARGTRSKLLESVRESVVKELDAITGCRVTLLLAYKTRSKNLPKP